MRTDSGKKTLAMVMLAMAAVAMVGCDKTEPVAGDDPATPVSTTAVSDSTSTQGHVAVSGGYTLRANAVQSDVLSPDMLAQYGIEGGADRGVLNLVVLEQGPDGEEVTVSADVTARQQNLLGQFEDIEMQPITANDSISYIGTFKSSPQENFRFEVTAQPTSSDTTLVIEFEERFAVLESRR